jgi:hypothetical protein
MQFGVPYVLMVANLTLKEITVDTIGSAMMMTVTINKFV